MTEEQVIEILNDVLHLPDRASRFNRDTPLLGAVPELDSIAVVSVLNAIEEHFGFSIEDDEIGASLFETVGSLTTFVDGKLSSLVRPAP